MGREKVTVGLGLVRELRRERGGLEVEPPVWSIGDGEDMEGEI